MDHLSLRRVPRHIIGSLDASVRDIAEGNIHDALSVLEKGRQADRGWSKIQSYTNALDG